MIPPVLNRATSGPAGLLARFYRSGEAIAPVAVLLVANAIPVLGVLFFGWSLLMLLILYWLENGIVGFWSVGKIAFAAAPEGEGPDGLPAPQTTSHSVFVVMFFCFHYGGFWIMHGLAIVVIIAIAGLANLFRTLAVNDAAPLSSLVSSLGTIEVGPLLFAAAVMFVSHGVSFVWNYILGGEYLKTTPDKQMLAPYGRVVVLHLTVLLGGALALALGSPLGVLIVLALGKAVLDLALYAREHRRFRAPAVAAAASATD
jgi:hypothetical protein